jgi:hypothetical protein
MSLFVNGRLTKDKRYDFNQLLALIDKFFQDKEGAIESKIKEIEAILNSKPIAQGYFADYHLGDPAYGILFNDKRAEYLSNEYEKTLTARKNARDNANLTPSDFTGTYGASLYVVKEKLTDAPAPNTYPQPPGDTPEKYFKSKDVLESLIKQMEEDPDYIKCLALKNELSSKNDQLSKLLTEIKYYISSWLTTFYGMERMIV